MYRGSDCVFRGTGTWLVQPAALFERLRRISNGAASGTAQPEQHREPATRDSDSLITNAVIAVPHRTGSEFATTLIVDDNHPYFFDHPCDHVPGMLLLEACAQLAKAAAAHLHGTTAVRLRTCEVYFARFVERDAPAKLTARVHPGGLKDGAGEITADIEISQQGITAGRAIIGVASGSGPLVATQ